MYFQATVRVQNRGESREVWFVVETDHENLREVYDEFGQEWRPLRRQD